MKNNDDNNEVKKDYLAWLVGTLAVLGLAMMLFFGYMLWGSGGWVEEQQAQAVNQTDLSVSDLLQGLMNARFEDVLFLGVIFYASIYVLRAVWSALNISDDKMHIIEWVKSKLVLIPTAIVLVFFWGAMKIAPSIDPSSFLQFSGGIVVFSVGIVLVLLSSVTVSYMAYGFVPEAAVKHWLELEMNDPESMFYQDDEWGARVMAKHEKYKWLAQYGILKPARMNPHNFVCY